ncbi:DUF2971 domain-containing protein [Aliivibrio fischeri]|uniref:DUF2971 domain-containing protein n=1 Tax=Aliivibrio fischeri TaxID=668 RepID=UPI0012DA8681|nr:DUF2971 domain-containing protein [Aliivibrio fischeri]
MNNLTISDYLNRDKPEKLWHYTSINVFNSILSAQPIPTFWMTEISYLNDHQEYEHGFEIIKSVLDKKIIEYEASSEVSEFLSLLNATLFFRGHLDRSLDDANGSGIFVLSFTEESDLLSQWRAYTPNGHGISIAVDPSFSLNTILYPVIYNENLKIEYANIIFNEVINGFLSLDNRTSPILKNELIQQFIGKAKVACSLMKDKGFSEEKEWRYVVFNQSHSSIFLREGDCYLTPYIKLSITREHFKAVVLGPNPHMNLCKKSIELLKSKYQLKHISTAISSIPYRG